MATKTSKNFRTEGTIDEFIQTNNQTDKDKFCHRKRQKPKRTHIEGTINQYIQD